MWSRRIPAGLGAAGLPPYRYDDTWTAGDRGVGNRFQPSTTMPPPPPFARSSTRYPPASTHTYLWPPTSSIRRESSGRVQSFPRARPGVSPWLRVPPVRCIRDFSFQTNRLSRTAGTFGGTTCTLSEHRSSRQRTCPFTKHRHFSPDLPFPPTWGGAQR